MLDDDGLWLLHTVVVSAKAHGVVSVLYERLAANGSVGYVKGSVGSIPSFRSGHSWQALVRGALSQMCATHQTSGRAALVSAC